MADQIGPNSAARGSPSTPAFTRVIPPSGALIGRSLKGRPIIKREYRGSSAATETVLLFAGIHGDESTTVFASTRLVELLDREPKLVPPNVHLVIVPLANPDGYEAHTRQNSAGVDLNRNFPAKNFQVSKRHNEYWPGPGPLTEPESRALHDLVVSLKPARILSLHSIKPGKHGVNYDGPAKALAQMIASKNGYDVLETMGYPTPGSFGSWAGIDRQIQTITLEFPSRTPGAKAWEDNREALLTFIRGR
jgi:murein peptide amidase A